MHVLIAGCGELGMAIGRQLIARRDRVTGLRRNAESLPSDFQRLSVDLCGDLSCVPEQFDAVIYAATAASRDEQGYRNIYVHAQRRLRQRVRCARWLFVSSTAVYPDDGSVVTEASAAQPAAFNGRVLKEGEDVALSTPEGCCVRLAGIYGPGREMLLRRVRRGDPLARSRHYTNRIHIDDAASLCVRLLDNDAPPIVNGVDDMPCGEADILSWLADAMALPRLPIASELPSGKRVSNALARSLGWRPTYASYREGYAAMLRAPVDG